MSTNLRFLFLGDLVGRPGRSMFQKWISPLKEKHRIDAVILNGENCADNGRGIAKKDADFFFEHGANAITTGNHIWAQKETALFLHDYKNVVRPANYPSMCPGKGYTIIDIRGFSIAIVNIQGRIFMHEHLDCPFRTIESLLLFLKTKTNIIFIDIHAEATSEKQCMGFFVDGKVSGVVGTHTHVQTADEKILPGGTAYITDLGFSGALYSSLGMRKDEIIAKFVTQMPHRFMVDEVGPFGMYGVIIEVDAESGKAQSIERISVIDSELTLT